MENNYDNAPQEETQQHVPQNEGNADSGFSNQRKYESELSIFIWQWELSAKRIRQSKQL